MTTGKNNHENGNRLVGWFVSYGLDKLGKAFEIRSGRTLISSDSNPSTRILTIADDGISAPHLAVKANAKHRVLVQDIFSEQGSFMTRGDADSESPITGPVELHHGDWIRVGEHTRFQVCLIDGPNR